VTHGPIVCASLPLYILGYKSVVFLVFSSWQVVAEFLPQGSRQQRSRRTGNGGSGAAETAAGWSKWRGKGAISTWATEENDSWSETLAAPNARNTTVRSVTLAKAQTLCKGSEYTSRADSDHPCPNPTGTYSCAQPCILHGGGFGFMALQVNWEGNYPANSLISGGCSWRRFRD